MKKFTNRMKIILIAILVLNTTSILPSCIPDGQSDTSPDAMTNNNCCSSTISGTGICVPFPSSW